ncbi:MAG TPA: disulfide reductase [Syntrophomonas sp.]|jgi:heterodisulfide reductase subunit B|nr:disulfide reductase [Syntrophomonas sp.]HCF70938.1 disulfide reductase [Syntrophomonas sp.]
MKLAYYPGCSLDGSGVEYGLSVKRMAELLNVELCEIDDWNCCGATSAHNTDKLLSLALPARNLAKAEKMGMDTLAPCAACYNRFRHTEHTVRHDSEMRSKVEKAIDMEYQAANETLSVLDLLTSKVGTDNIRSQVVKPLQGMKAACYYGCLLVRPKEITGFDDEENPHTMDDIMQALGAETIDWSHKTECCGASLATSRPDVGGKMIYEILRNASEAGAECIVTACPLCMMNLDMRQAGTEKKFNTKFNIPVYYVTELLAIACGDSPQTVGTHRHFVEAVKYLENLSTAAASPAETVREEAKTENGESDEALQKKINALTIGFQKNPAKMAARLIAEEEKAAILVEIVSSDEKKLAKLASLMATDNDKAAKAAQAYVAAEIKKRG